MAILLTEARTLLKNAVLHAGNCFQAAKLDAAIVETGERLIHEGGLNRKIATAVTIASNKEVNIATTTTDFSYQDLVDIPFLAPGSDSYSWRKLLPVALEQLRALQETNGSTTGEPEFITWIEDAKCWLFPTPDAVYTLNLPYTQPLTAAATWTIGTRGTWSSSTTYDEDDVVTHTPSGTAYTYRSLVANNLNNTPADNASTDYWQLIGTTASYPAPDPQTVSLNIHNKWAVAWLRTGARAQLLYGAPGHPETDKMAAEFERLIERVNNAATPGGVWYADDLSDNERTWGPHMFGG